MLKFKPEYLQVYFVGGTQNIDGNVEKFLNQVELACQNGITMFQYREKGPHSLPDNKKLIVGSAIRKITSKYNIPLVVDDDIQLAHQIDADGIHVGQSDTPIQETIKEADGLFVGLSVHDLKELSQSNLKNVNYLGVGPIFQTHSKVDPKPQIGTKGLRTVMNHVSLPIVAIGGIKSFNVKEVLQTGVQGISVISDIMKSSNLKDTISMLKGEK